MQLNFKILGEPKSKQSFRIGIVHGRVMKYQNSKIHQEENNIRWQIINQLPKDFVPIETKIFIKKLHYIFSIPKSFSKTKIKEISDNKMIFKSTKPDLTDNLAKGLFDAMQGIVFLNDSQVCSIENCKKFYGFIPRIEVEIEA
jgi:Holliday junction resolvase RusA-like endonuclease